MIKRLVTLFLPALVASGAFAQTENQTAIPQKDNTFKPRTILKANPVNLFLRPAESFFIEQTISKNSSLQLGLFCDHDDNFDVETYEFAITPEYRYYLGKSGAPKGFFVGAYLSYEHSKYYGGSSSVSEYSNSLEVNFSGRKYASNSFSGGVNIGQQFLIKDRISLEWFVGAGYKINNYSSPAYNNGTFGELDIRLGITLGIAL